MSYGKNSIWMIPRRHQANDHVDGPSIGSSHLEANMALALSAGTKAPHTVRLQRVKVTDQSFDSDPLSAMRGIYLQCAEFRVGFLAAARLLHF
ncbi:MAG: hypothetical protein ACM3JC_03445 [Rudaea sp.]